MGRGNPVGERQVRERIQVYTQEKYLGVDQTTKYGDISGGRQKRLEDDNDLRTL